MGSLIGGFLQGFAQAKQAKQKHEEDKIERDARLKLFELQMKREQQAQVEQQQTTDARQQVIERMTGQSPLTAAPGVAIQDPRGPKSLTEMLADPEGTLLLLRSGMLKGDDVLTAESNKASREMMQSVMGGGAPGGMELQGVKLGPNGQIMPDFGLPQITSPQTVMTPDGPRLRTFNPRTGAQVADLGEPKPDTVAPETAGRISGLVQAQEIAGQIRNQFIAPDGKVNRQLVLTTFVNAPGSKGRELRNDIGIAVDAVLRARTGAGVNTTEQKQVVDQFLPSPLDDDATIASKLSRLDQFIGGTLDIATLPASVRKRLEVSQGGGLPSGIPAGSKQIGTSKGKPVYQTPDGKQLIVD